MKKVFICLIVGLFCALSTRGATCTWCDPALPPGYEYIIPGSVVTTYYTNILAVSSFANGDVVCDANNRPTTAPTKTCSANGGTSTVKSWKVTGQISYSYFEVGAEVGQDVTYNANCGGTVVISSWCQCCKTYAGLLYKKTVKQLQCNQASTTPPYSVCSGTKTGQIDEYQNVLCSELPCTVSPTCKLSCPTGGG